MASKTPPKEQETFSKEILETAPERALAVVRQIGADEQADLIDAWVTSGNIAAVAAISREDEAPSPARKAARRAVNVLKSKGVKIPEATHVSRPFAQAADSITEARFESPDGSDTYVVSIIRRTPGREARAVHVAIRRGVGAVSSGGGAYAGHALREWENERRDRRGAAPVPVPLEWARWRIKEALNWNRQSRAPLPMGLDLYGDLYEPAPESEPAHPMDALRAALTDDDIAKRSLVSGTLHNEPEFASYVLPDNAVIDILMHVGERITAGSEPSNDEMAALLKEEGKAAADRLFVPEARQNMARMMLDVAVSIFNRVGKERALDLLAAREAVLRAGLVTDPPRDIPFLTMTIEKSFAYYAMRNQGQLPIPQPRRQVGSGLALSPDQLAAVEAAKLEQSESSTSAESPLQQ